MLKSKPMYFLYWVIAGIFIFLFIFLLVKLFPFYRAVFSFIGQLLAPFIVACLIAYLLYPIIKKIHHYNVPKSIAILMIYLLFFGGGAYLMYRIYPAIIFQLRDLNEHLPQLIQMYETIIYQAYESTSALPEVVHDQMDQVIRNLEMELESMLGRLLGGVTKLFDMIVFLTVLPVLVFYFLKDYNRIKAYIKKFIPNHHHPQMSQLIHAVDHSLGAYMRGQLLVCLFVSLATYVVFQLLGLEYALLLAIIMGLTNIIPYFGPIIGSIPAVAIALTISGKLVLFVVGGVFVIQLIESNLLSPYIVGKSIDIHPVAIIFALLLGGKVGGVIGMIIAVPLLTVSKVIVTHIVQMKHDH
ncbi:MAG TPA: AI-2E family transporter [Bacillota bacterium]|nr:AI-2E family transporter [Bacillota bacterium]